MPAITPMNFRERERLKRLRERWVTRFKRRSPQEQKILLLALEQGRQETKEQQLDRWLASYPRRNDVQHVDFEVLPGETADARQARIVQGLLYDLSLAIDEFGYEAIYFGVGCMAFPDAVDPWRDGHF